MENSPDTSPATVPAPAPVLIAAYIEQLTERERCGYEIAKNHLGHSFNIENSVGYKEWKTKLMK
jgi:hypothetical protein